MGYSTMVFAGGVFGKTIIQEGQAAALCESGQHLLIKQHFWTVGYLPICIPK